MLESLSIGSHRDGSPGASRACLPAPAQWISSLLTEGAPLQDENLDQVDQATTATPLPEPEAAGTQPVVTETSDLIHAPQFWMDYRLGHTFSDTPWTGWLILLLGIFAGVLLGRVVQNTLRAVAKRMIARGWNLRGTVFLSAAGPASLAIITYGTALGLMWVAMSNELRVLSLRIVLFLNLLSLGWLIFNLVDLVDVAMRHLTKRTGSALDAQVVPLVRKTIRIFVIILFTLFAAENIFGADIGAWLAGLGIAGLAFSLAAQDSIKNLFGSITIFGDRPFILGDLIKVDGFTGLVENIGFRSTRLRTLEGHVVTIPNSKVVDSSVENIFRRRNIRRTLEISITYDTPPEKIERAVQIVKEIFAEPDFSAPFDLEKSPPRVVFDKFNTESLNLLILYWFHPADHWQFMYYNERFNLRLIREFRAAGIEFAFPTRTLYLAGDEKRQLSLRLEQGQARGDLANDSHP
jgi:MscS family membrane protein